jgi:hypothetical protein
MAFQCVPFNGEWTGDTKLDLRGIYRRPSGDLTSDLPLRRHTKWVAKGLEYVTLADAESFAIAVPFLRAQGLNPQDYVAGRDGDGRPTPWNVEAYLADQQSVRAAKDDEIRALVAEFGVDVVEKIKGIPVPAHLRPETKAAKREKASA